MKIFYRLIVILGSIGLLGVLALFGLKKLGNLNKKYNQEVVRSRLLVPLRVCITDIAKVDEEGVKFLIKYEGEVPVEVDLSSATFDNTGKEVVISNLREPRMGKVKISHDELLKEIPVEYSFFNKMFNGPDYSKIRDKHWKKEEEEFKKIVDGMELVKTQARENTERILQQFYKMQGKKVRIKNWEKTSGQNDAPKKGDHQ